MGEATVHHLHPRRVTLCALCEQPVLPNGEGVMRGVTGFEKKRKGGGTNMLYLREPIDEWAHERCVKAEGKRR